MSGITFPLAAHLLKNAVAAAECPLCAISGHCPRPKTNFVRFGPKADMCGALAHVRFVPIADIPPFKRRQLAYTGGTTQ